MSRKALTSSINWMMLVEEDVAVCRPKDGSNHFLSVGNGDLDLHAWLNGDGGDLLDDLGGGVQVDDPLVDSHLEPVPGLGALTARGFPRGDPKGLGGHADGALHLQLLLLGTLDQVGADLLQGLDGPRGEGDPDAVDHGLLSGSALAILVTGHCVLGC